MPYYDPSDVVRNKQLKPFTVETLDEIQAIKDWGQNFLDYVNRLPPSREISVAKTKIEEAVMWAVKGVTA